MYSDILSRRTAASTAAKIKVDDGGDQQAMNTLETIDKDDNVLPVENPEEESPREDKNTELYAEVNSLYNLENPTKADDDQLLSEVRSQYSQ